MFYVLSKVVFAFIAPSNFSLLLIGAGICLGFLSPQLIGWRRLGRGLTVAGFGFLLIFGFSPLGKWMAKPLEDRFAGAVVPDGSPITHIVLLGGFEIAALAEWRQSLATNAAGERLMMIPVLARLYPQAKIVFTGGYGDLLGERVTAVDEIRDYLLAVGIDGDRIELEGRSRTTWENALFTRDLPAVKDAACPCGCLLVTSAWHMPRSVGIFRQAGFDEGGRRLYPFPVDFRTAGAQQIWSPFGWLHEGLTLSDLAAKEWIGLMAYWLKGRTSELWPGPREIPAG